MIGDKLLALAEAAIPTSQVTGPDQGYHVTPNLIPKSVLRDLGAGCQLYCTVSILQDFTTTSSTGVVQFLVKETNDATRGTVDNIAYENFNQTLGRSQTFLHTDLKSGKQFSFPIGGTDTAGTGTALAQGSTGRLYIYGVIITTDINQVEAVGLASGSYSMEFTLQDCHGVRTVGSAKVHDAPYYPTAITQV